MGLKEVFCGAGCAVFVLQPFFLPGVFYYEDVLFPNSRKSGLITKYMREYFQKKCEVGKNGKISGGFGLILALALSLFPIFLWLITQPLNAKFASISSIFTSLGQITGLVGMAMLSVTVVLSSRPVFLDRIFCGLNNLYAAHRNMGIASFLLILVHPLVLSLSYMFFSGKSAALFLLPGSDFARDLGLAATFLMMVFIVITIFAKIKYQMLKSAHKFFGLVFVLSALHTLLVKSDVSRNPYLHWYMLFLMALGMTAFFYKTILGRFLVKNYIYTVREINQMPSKSVEIVMTPQGRPMHYLAGQFVFISFYGENISSESHPFSISSCPKDPNLRILVKSLGDYTSKLSSIPKGMMAKVEGPFGVLCYVRAPNKNQIWIAGGSGIAPFLSMARNLKNSGSGYSIHLYYCAASEKEIICLEEFKKIAGCCEFKFIPFCQDSMGFIDAEKIIKISGEIKERDIFLCGPPPMVRSLKSQFAKLRIPEQQIHSEEFQLL